MATSPLLSRADEITLGDYIAVHDYQGNSVIILVVSIERVGDDVIFNDALTISEGNLVVRLGKSFTISNPGLSATV